MPRPVLVSLAWLLFAVGILRVGYSLYLWSPIVAGIFSGLVALLLGQSLYNVPRGHK